MTLGGVGSAALFLAALLIFLWLGLDLYAHVTGFFAQHTAATS